MHRCLGIGSSGATDFCRTGPIQHFFEFFSSCFPLHGLFTSSLGSRNVHLIIPLVPLIALSFDHQNHSKWHKWCHVRYKEEKGERERENEKKFCGVGPTCGSWYRERYGVWIGAEERDIEQRILMTRTKYFV